MKRVWRVLRVYFVVCGIGVNIFVGWMAAGWPIFFDRWLNVSERPIKAEAIVCLSGGLAGNNLPVDRGWERIYTAIELYFDGWADKVVFTGGGTGQISEGEIYAEAASWLGLPEEAAFIDPYPTSTAEHPENILKIKDINIKKDSPLNIVTTSLHSRRASLCFKKAEFTNFRMVTGYTARSKNPDVVRSIKTSQIEGFRPSQKRYDDFLFRLRKRSNYFLAALREWVAVGYYKIKGYI